jgi:tetratricopeptide (TPR) repeat protein
VTEAQLQALFHRALERQQRGDLDGAATDYAQILTQRPDSLPVLANLGGVFYQQGLFEEALGQYDRDRRMRSPPSTRQLPATRGSPKPGRRAAPSFRSCGGSKTH